MATDWHHDWFGDWHHDWYRFTDGPPPGGPPLDGYGDPGVDTLVLDLENGYTVAHSWVTDVIKFSAGAEQRIARNRKVREAYSGQAYLAGDDPRSVRAKLAQYAAIGARFLLALPHEALTLRADAVGTTVYVHAAAAARRDWIVPGQRAVVARRNATTKRLEFVNVVIQSATVDSITLDVDPDVFWAGGMIMPCKAVYLEPQQDFARYPVSVEKWKLDARGAAPLDFAPEIASVALPGIFSGLTAYARTFGLAGNGRPIVAQAVFTSPGLVETTAYTRWDYNAGASTVGDFITALGFSSLVTLGGAAVDPSTIVQAGDAFSLATAGGTEGGAVGTGAALTTYDGRPVWTERIANAGTNSDGIHAMTQIIDHGGIPYALGTADQADWYRAVVINGGRELTWQWFRLFMHTVRGRAKKFWLATWRDDLAYVSHVGALMVIDDVDFTTWWPRLREHVQIEQTDGTITYARVTTAADNGDGTRTLTLSAALSAVAVRMVSWLELCRFEDGDGYQTTHNANGFSVSLKARVVP